MALSNYLSSSDSVRCKFIATLTALTICLTRRKGSGGSERIALVNHIEWLGGQFSAEGLGAVDEWTLYRNRRVNFPRSGIFLEVMLLIGQYNGRRYGKAMPGNAFTATDTIEPAAGACIFKQILSPYTAGGTAQVQIYSWYRPVAGQLNGNRVVGVIFEHVKDPLQRLTVSAQLTIDCSDWGDVIRLVLPMKATMVMGEAHRGQVKGSTS